MPMHMESSFDYLLYRDRWRQVDGLRQKIGTIRSSLFITLQYQLVREDPFAEMATSFQTRQAAACDGEVLNLNCPSGTKVWCGFLNFKSLALSPYL